MFLYHYYDGETGPFRTISDLSVAEAKKVLTEIRAAKPASQPAQRHPDYIKDRLHYEEILRDEFVKKAE